MHLLTSYERHRGWRYGCIHTRRFVRRWGMMYHACDTGSNSLPNLYPTCENMTSTSSIVDSLMNDMRAREKARNSIEHSARTELAAGNAIQSCSLSTIKVMYHWGIGWEMADCVEGSGGSTLKSLPFHNWSLSTLFHCEGWEILCMTQKITALSMMQMPWQLQHMSW